MSKMGAYQPPEKYKNYLQPTSKPFRSHPLYKEKVWTLEDQIYKKLKKVSELLEGLYPKLTDDFTRNNNVIKKNIETLIEDLDFMQGVLNKNPYSFNTNKLKTNQHRITEMKNVCDTLQSVKSYEQEHKKLSQIKHALHELEHLILQTSFESSLKKALVKSKPKTIPAKKERVQVAAKKKIKAKPKVSSVKRKAVPKKAKPATKVLKTKKIDRKQPKKSAAPVHKLKQPVKKIAKPKPKVSAGNKKRLTAKPKSKIKSTAAHKKK